MLEITLPKSEYRSLDPFLSLSDSDIPKYELNIVKTKNKRSLDANALFYSRLSDLHRNRTDRPACMGMGAV